MRPMYRVSPGAGAATTTVGAVVTTVGPVVVVTMAGAVKSVVVVVVVVVTVVWACAFHAPIASATAANRTDALNMTYLLFNYVFSSTRSVCMMISVAAALSDSIA